MARRKDHSREELTQLAIQAGRQIVIDQGPNALTTRKVAQAIGYTPGTLYNVFKNIDALIAAINIESMHSFADSLRTLHQPGETSESRIRRIAQAYLDFHHAQPQLWSLLFAQPLNYNSDDYHAAIHAIFDQVCDAIMPLSSSPTLARQKAKILWSTLHGICLLQQSGKLNVSEPDPAEDLLTHFLDQFLQ
ncbi:TetR/AcrR family transcriptional regulator [Coraliomargarita sp. SDUM461004]|uniref:TetR/AcrR family transcriptional regulator n=1 Tax=Thalassobacterium sedimentorum TaxID=3041258 RepID=A0ABU1AGJ6_9BACT|nr:TetR/AcrR family transcriptional regulator [Coraliomargarita sp. SDUM461004]MDQ8193961.1 TetR/AcrR family transcriptional regulator [Coraliomargarita sp. SDUM461004]